MSNVPKINNFKTKTIMLPVSKKEIKIRPYLVKEERILLSTNEINMMSQLEYKEVAEKVKDIPAAADSLEKARLSMNESTRDFLENLLNTIDACILTPGADCRDFVRADVLYTFKEIRKLSYGENIRNQPWVCKTKHDGVECGHKNDLVLGMDDFEVVIPESYTPELKVVIDESQHLVATLRYPSYTETALTQLDNMATSQTQAVYNQCASVISDLRDETRVYNNLTYQDKVDTLDQLTIDYITQFIEFAQNQPVMVAKAAQTCSKCNTTVNNLLPGDFHFFM